MSEKLIYVVNDHDGSYGKFWGNLGEIARSQRYFLDHLGEFALVCFTGGPDVSPELYGHRNLASYNDPIRDPREQGVFKAALANNIPMTGICRGSQFLNVMCGGTMVQHLGHSHGGHGHQCYTSDGDAFGVTSTHHQMSVLGEGGEYLGWSREAILVEACTYDGDLGQQNLAWVPEFESDGSALQVTEAFAYPEQKVFAVQHHPEYQDIEEEAPQWTLKMIREICFGEKTVAS